MFKNIVDDLEILTLAPTIQIDYKNPDEILSWISNWCSAFHNEDINCDAVPLIRIIESAGWKRNAALGLPQEQYLNSKFLTAAYIIGQVLDCLYLHLSFELIFYAFYQRYLNTYAD